MGKIFQLDKNNRPQIEKDGGNKRFIWKIKSFSENLRLAKEGWTKKIESDPFYIKCYGYKLKVISHPYFTG